MILPTLSMLSANVSEHNISDLRHLTCTPVLGVVNVTRFQILRTAKLSLVSIRSSNCYVKRRAGGIVLSHRTRCWPIQYFGTRPQFTTVMCHSSFSALVASLSDTDDWPDSNHPHVVMARSGSTVRRVMIFCSEVCQSAQAESVAESRVCDGLGSLVAYLVKPSISSTLESLLGDFASECVRGCCFEGEETSGVLELLRRFCMTIR